MFVLTHRQWYAIQTRSQSERCLTRDLDAKNIENYCPVFREVRQWSDRKKEIDRPVFPGYVFARFEDSGSTRLKILQSSGAVRILGSAEMPEAIPEYEIEAIRRLIESSLSCYAHPLLKEGCRVVVKCGPLKGVEGQLVRVKGQTRLVLSVKLLGKAISTEVGVRDVELVTGSIAGKEGDVRYAS
jgi:transcriptional antiterminator NusG